MKITDLKARTVAIPTEAPLRHSTGVHPGYLMRTIIEVLTDEGITGLGEVGGGDQRGMFQKIKPRLIGESPFDLERLKQRTLRQIYYISNPRIYAAIEIACLDIQGKASGRSVSELIGGRLRDHVPFDMSLSYRYRSGERGGESTPKEMVEYARREIERCGFRSLKLKAGVLPPDNDIAILCALRRELGREFGLRVDPNGFWSRGTAIRVAKALEDCDLEYLEDPTWGLEGMAEVRARTSIPLATNMCVSGFEHIAPAAAMKSVDVILSDIYYWEGIRGVKSLATVCECFRWGLGMHSGSEFGVTLAAMLHTAASLPNLTYSVDTLYHHMADDVIAGGMMRFVGGALAVPEGPGLGVALDESKMKCYEKYFEEHGDYYARFHEDTNRPDWFPINPGW
jgi:glucarate dehydratase